jgi:putative ABC transport system permease protein
MLRNYLVTALRNLERNRLYGAISILGLAVAFTAALLIAQFVRKEFSYDRWLPGYQQIYKVAEVIREPGQAPSTTDLGPSGFAGRLRVQLPGAIGVARLLEDTSTPLRARPGDPGVLERSFAWADPDIFKVFDLPVLGGDLQSSLQQPDTIVITRRVARWYFGRDLPIGATLQVQAIEPQPRGSAPPTNIPWHSMRVTAVLKDLPPNTNLTTEMFASDRSAYSAMSFVDRSPPGFISNFTFVRLSPSATAADLQRALVAAGQVDAKAFFAGVGGQLLFHAVPLAELHLTAFDDTAAVVNPVGNRSNAYALSAVAALIVLVAAINFVTLLTARAARRAMEVGVRKATGASRADLMIQFIGEALIQVAFSTAIALALAELLIGPFGAFAQRGLTLDYLHDRVLLAGIVGAALVVGLLAAVYPALVLSSFRPAAVLKGGSVQMAGTATARQALVVVQFAVLIGLLVTTATLYRQTEFALARGFGGGADGGKIVAVIGGCDQAFPDDVRRLPGVSAAACSSLNALNTPYLKNGTAVQLSGGRQETFDIAPVDFGFLELYGLKPLAGRVFSRDHGEDGVLADRNATTQPTVVLNETAAHRIGFSDARAAVGQTLLWPNYAPPGPPTMKPSRIIGVIQDMPLTVRTATDPFVYYVSPYRLRVLSVRLTGQDIPGTMRGIDQAWKRTGHTAPIQETFVSQFRIGLYLDLIIQGTAVAICAGLAILIACLGLFALSAYTTERRTKEIGVRKVMGADTRQVVLLLLWQFTMPVLVATAIAIPIGFVAMDWWLRGFAYHVDLPAWTFVLAAAAGVVIAWLTVSYQSFVVARAKPASALRYE